MNNFQDIRPHLQTKHEDKIKVCAIYASATNGAFGLHDSKNGLPWVLPTELDYFRKTIGNHPVIMGRNTKKVMPFPLPNRKNIVISGSQFGIEKPWIHARSLRDAIKFGKEMALEAGMDKVFVIGGVQVLSKAMDENLLDVIHHSLIEETFKADVFLPEILMPSHFDESWTCTSEESVDYDRHPYRIQVWEKGVPKLRIPEDAQSTTIY